MKAVLTIDEIKNLIHIPALIGEIESGFVWYSKGRTQVPPVGFLHFDDLPGNVHIKYGYVQGDDYYVLKVASAFAQNKQLNRPVNDGVVMGSSQTGAIECVLVDEGCEGDD